MKRLMMSIIVGVICLTGIALPVSAVGTSRLAANSLSAASSGSYDVLKSGCQAGGSSGTKVCGTGSDTELLSLIKNIINTLIYVAGIIAVIMIVIGGIRYITSNGDNAGVSGAKNTILYAVIGLVIAIMSFAIVNFVLTWTGGGDGKDQDSGNSGSASAPATKQT
ncbi:MAG: pilin [Candidatus Saccharimonadales bacterium]